MNEKSVRFFKLVRDFLTVYLPGQKAVSPNTIKSYRESLNLLLNYICGRSGVNLGDLSFEHLSRETVEDFLDYLEKERHCGVSTRNHRLACIRSFIKYAGVRDVGVQAYANDLCSIPLKKDARSTVVSFFSEAALKTILEQPDARKKKELRNLFFMILMYDTGARNQELLDLRLSSIHFEEKAPYVVITGKGMKTRLVPVMQKLLSISRNILLLFTQDMTQTNIFFIPSGKERNLPCRQTILRDSSRNMASLLITLIRKCRKRCILIYLAIAAACICTGAACRWYCWLNGLGMRRLQRPWHFMQMPTQK